MNQITDPPLTYTFGQSFDYSVWTKNTVLTLCNVPWNNDYRDIVKFAGGQTALNTYIDASSAPKTNLDRMSLAPINRPIRINLPVNKALNYNYVRAHNPLQSFSNADTIRDYYYFVTSVEYGGATHNTIITVQLDVFQTFGYGFKFGNCYIERGHIGMANVNAFSNYGRDYLTIPEGLDVGSEYQTIWTSTTQIINATDILIYSTVRLDAAAADDAGNPDLVAATGSYLQGIAVGGNFYLASMANLINFMASISVHPWQSEGIISLTMIPTPTRYDPSFTYDVVAETGGYLYSPPSEALPDKLLNVLSSWRDSALITDMIPARYRGLKKLFTSPYMMIEVTTHEATPIVLKPESWNNPDASLLERASLMPPQQRVIFSPVFYNSAPGAPDPDGATGDDGGEYLDLFTMISDFPTLPIVNNGALSYLASNAHSIAYQYSSADYSRSKALYAAQTGYDNATAGVNNQVAQSGIQNAQTSGSVQIANQNAASQSILGSVGGVASGGTAGAINGGLPGAAIGASMGLVSGSTQNISTMMSNQAALDQANLAMNTNVSATQANINTASNIRDTNKSLADWAANGDYANSIGAINAKVQDVNLLQPTTSGQLGGNMTNILHGGSHVSVRWKTIDPAHIASVGEYWLRFGYQVQRFAEIPESLQVMSVFTYWKLTQTYFDGVPAMPESMKQTLRGIFEKGVTVWNNPADIGNKAAMDTNTPLAGVSL